MAAFWFPNSKKNNNKYSEYPEDEIWFIDAGSKGGHVEILSWHEKVVTMLTNANFVYFRCSAF